MQSSSALISFIFGIAQHDASWRKFADLFITSCEYLIFFLVVHFVMMELKLFGRSQINQDMVFVLM